MDRPLYLADQGTPAFEAERERVDVVCVGDSLTGWNNYGPATTWPFPTYPDRLAELCVAHGLRVANGGIAGEVSDNGPAQMQWCLRLFPHARWCIFGMGTNDLIAWPNAETTSQRILDNLARMVAATLSQGRQPALFNVPPVKESLLLPRRAAKIRGMREAHNQRLQSFCTTRGLPLVDICTLLHDEHFDDTLHPNATGARLIAEEIHRVLKGRGLGA